MFRDVDDDKYTGVTVNKTSINTRIILVNVICFNFSDCKQTMQTPFFEILTDSVSEYRNKL